MNVIENSPSEVADEISNQIMQLQLNLDEIYNDNDLYNKVKDELIRKSYYFHWKNNDRYRNYAELILAEKGYGQEKEIDVESIPLLPSSFFKKNDINLLSLPRDYIIKDCLSSGTSGSLSVVPRDDLTLGNFLGSISSIVPAFFGLDRTGNEKGFVLGPSTEEAGDLWFSYVISCISLLMQTEILEKKGDLDLDIACDKIRKSINNQYGVVIIGPPFKILELTERILQQKNWPDFPDKSFIISAGGWKNKESKLINDAQFREIVKNRLKLKNDSSIRDMFNMVELNTILPECEFHNKHTPPWLDIVIRDPINNGRLSDGEIGLISFLDASAISYPGFILSEDIGYIERNKCQCGRNGPVLKVVRRMNNIESRGCALKMAVGTEKVNAGNGRFHKSIYRN